MTVQPERPKGQGPPNAAPNKHRFLVRNQKGSKMAVIAYTNGLQINGREDKYGRQDQFVAYWDVRVGDEVCCPEGVIVPGGGPLVVIEVVDDGNDPAEN